jgi:hypothetical protein
MTTEEQTKQDLLVLIQVRNQRIAELELDKLSLVRNQCKGGCNNANGNKKEGQEERNQEKKNEKG